jgi:glutamine amidotransferase
MKETKIYIPKLSIGNTKSVVNMINRLGGEVVIANTPEDLLSAKKIILPGVGAFDTGMRELNEDGWSPILNKLVLEDKVPVLGICLGMQFFFDGSEEGILPGLKWMPGYLRKFQSSTDNPIKIPHMGWNTVSVQKIDGLIPAYAEEEVRYYFVHSYHAVCENYFHVVATANHGSNITAAVQHDNIYGVQFHPEKSHRFGMALLNNFLSI